MEMDLLLSVTGQQGGLLVHVNHVWIHAGHQGSFHHGPVFRVQINIPDVAAATRSYKTYNSNNASA